MTHYGQKPEHNTLKAQNVCYKLPPTKSQMILNAYQSPDGISNEGQSYAKDRLTKTPKKRKTKLTMIRMTIKYKLYKVKKQRKNPSKQKQYTLKHNSCEVTYSNTLKKFASPVHTVQAYETQ